MTFVRGTSSEADEKSFDFWNPVILNPGPIRGSCRVPRVHRLFIGYGDFEPTRKALDAAWKHLKWSLWVDGRRVSLAPFGTSDRTLFAFPAAGGKDVILREWSVILVGVTPGKHTIRYQATTLPARTISRPTWTFIVER